MQTTKERSVNRTLRYEKVQAAIENAFGTNQFRYTDFETAELIHAVAVGMVGWVAVIGNGDHGSYEWIVRHDGDRKDRRVFSHSNDGYGCDASALRHGLIEALRDCDPECMGCGRRLQPDGECPQCA